MNHNLPLKTRQANFIERSKECFGDKFDYSLTDYRKNTEYITLVCKRHGIFNTTPSAHLMSKHGACSECLKDDKREQVVSNIQKRLDKKFGTGSIIWVTPDVYVPNEKSEFICATHGTFENFVENVIFSRCGCPSCATDKIRAPRPNRKLSNNGAINWSKLERDRGLRELPSWVYIIRLKKDSEVFYKVGVSNQDSFYFRLKRYCKFAEAEIVQIHKGNMMDCYDMEQFILSQIDPYKPSFNFEGKTECFLSDKLDLLQPLKIEFQRVNRKVGGKPTQHYIGEITSEL